MFEPLFSIVTPFHNTAAYLAECIESVLAQSYSNFEYILVDNCSTDGSREIGQKYACRDSRIRLIRRSQLLSQVQNYNRALAEIAPESKYCKIVQADDYISSECVQLVVNAFEKSESIGLVSSYYLKGNTVRGLDFPCGVTVLSGKEMARLYFRTGIFVFGSPTTVAYRSTLVRTPRPFFDESLLHEDTEKCMQILEHRDFGFVHRVLSFLRTDNESISSLYRTFTPNELDRYIIVQRYAGTFLEAGEAETLQRNSKREYYRALAEKALRFPGPAFWQYHEKGLATINEKLDWPCLALQVGKALLHIASNPGNTAERVLRFWRKRASQEPGIRS